MPPSSPPRPVASLADAVDTSPLLGHSVADHLLRSRRFLRRPVPPLQGTAARLLRRASGRQMSLRETSVQVRENAAEQLENRQSDWAYSKPVVVLDILWNLALVVAAFSIMILSADESPDVPLRLWIVGYMVQCLFHMGCVLVEYMRRRREMDYAGSERSGGWGSGDLSAYLNSGSVLGSEESDSEDYVTEQHHDDEQTRS
ncbi:hypothetical protein CRG98_030763 [Punica granatum]|uniref:RING-type E3 ubiquitin transferase n=1 Tax=Punica granatum TaxID=22663 RepID=A0A2I0IY14_PUNGR|nr:hypothetical protein CRG98_030763 [Punica granatum]